MQTISGSFYEGDWKEGRIEGKGKLFYPSHKLAYEGEWKKDCFHGKGVFHKENFENSNEIGFDNDPNKIYENWVMYIGSFQNDLKHGRGRLILTNGAVFDGEFIDGDIMGPGVLTLGTGKKIFGNWMDHKFFEGSKTSE